MTPVAPAAWASDHFVTNGARATLDERDLAGHAGVVGGHAAAGRSARGRIDDAADGEHGSVGEHNGRRVRHRDEVRRRQVAVVSIAGDIGLRRRRHHVQDRRLRLVPDREIELVDLRVVAGRLQRRHDVVERLLVAGREHLTCVVVERGDLLQRDLVLRDVGYRDVADELFRLGILRGDAGSRECGRCLDERSDRDGQSNDEYGDRSCRECNEASLRAVSASPVGRVSAMRTSAVPPLSGSRTGSAADRTPVGGEG